MGTVGGRYRYGCGSRGIVIYIILGVGVQFEGRGESGIPTEVS